jgi:TPP-dependent pyruvate/acetoin dehydrogenase alpha subunit
MKEAGINESMFEQIEHEVKAELEEATTFARTSPDVTPAQALEGVYA